MEQFEIISAKEAQNKMISVIEKREEATLQIVNKLIIEAANDGQDRILLTENQYKYASSMLNRKGYRTEKTENPGEVIIRWNGVVK